MNRDQHFLAVAAEAINEVSAIVRESNERAARNHLERAIATGATLLNTLREIDKDTPKEVVEEIIYRHYKHARDFAPLSDPQTWGCLFGDNRAAMEARYQVERS